MFAKKFLSIVSLLFIGSALATDITLPFCTTLKGDTFAAADCQVTGETAVTHCLGGDKKIYEVTNTGTFACNTTPLAENVYIFKVPADTYVLTTEEPGDWSSKCTDYFTESGGNYSSVVSGDCTSLTWTESTYYQRTLVGNEHVSTVTLSSEDDSDPLTSVANRLVMYVCDGSSKCAQTIGYIKNTYDTDSTEKYSYYKILTSGGASAGAGSACVGTNNGEVSSTNGVCLSVAGKSVEFLAPGDYLLDGTLGTSIFTLPSNGNNSLVLTATANVIYYNKAFTQTDYCVDDATKKIQERTAQVCDDNACDKYYTCTAGDCKDTSSDTCTSPPTDCNLDSSDSDCNVGYYLADTGLKTLVDNANDEGDLYECTLNGDSGKIECTNISSTNSKIPLGYLINADDNHKTAIPIIECYLDGTRKCKAVAVTDTSCGSVAGTNVATPGKIFSDDANTTFKLCLDGTNAGVKGASSLSYLMNASGVLGIAAKADNFMIVNIDTTGNIKLELKADVTLNKYKFASSAKKLITKNSSDKSTYCTPVPTLVEYKHNKCEDGVVDEDLVYFYKATA